MEMGKQEEEGLMADIWEDRLKMRLTKVAVLLRSFHHHL